ILSRPHSMHDPSHRRECCNGKRDRPQTAAAAVAAAAASACCAGKQVGKQENEFI
ncbi:unnamed protein product, partial [Ceratitis capitata]